MRRSDCLLLAAALFAVGTAACDRLAPSHASNTTQVPAQRAMPAREAPAPPSAPAAAPRDTLTDSVITARIKAGILSDPGMSGTDVSVNTDRGAVSLTGTVKSQEQIALASAHAQRQDGVTRVDSQLSVNPQ